MHFWSPSVVLYNEVGRLGKLPPHFCLRAQRCFAAKNWKFGVEFLLNYIAKAAKEDQFITLGLTSQDINLPFKVRERSVVASL